MILEQSFRFEEELEHIIDFIALDSVAKALDFYDELINNIQNIPFRQKKVKFKWWKSKRTNI